MHVLAQLQPVQDRRLARRVQPEHPEVLWGQIALHKGSVGCVLLPVSHVVRDGCPRVTQHTRPLDNGRSDSGGGPNRCMTCTTQHHHPTIQSAQRLASQPPLTHRMRFSCLPPRALSVSSTLEMSEPMAPVPSARCTRPPSFSFSFFGPRPRPPLRMRSAPTCYCLTGAAPVGR